MKFLLLITFLMLVCIAAPAQIAPGKELNKYLIAYNVLVDSKTSDYDIFVMNPDGSGSAQHHK